MEKDFNKWNELKKTVHGEGEYKFYRAREAWWCALGLNIGFEQDGTGESYDRPILILKGFSKHVCLVVPLTTSRKKNPYHFDVGMVDGKEASAIISQIRLIDTKRLVDKIGFLEISVFERIRKAVKELL